MKKYRINLLLYFLGFFVFSQIHGQDLSQSIPMDSSIVIGQLENGLTYYIKHNPKPESKAELRLAINAGSVLETDEQQGLAHFLEHMAFNGTTNFEKNELINYLENLGVRFGADLNAHTSFDETVYKLTLPTDDLEIYDTGLQILRDWADGITLSDKDIDEERGVVAEELRSGLVGSRRLFNSYVPLITNNARYAERLPIGKLDVILNADYDELRDFYRDWYRPDLMAVIIVGDVDVNETLQKIKANFGDMKGPEDTLTRTVYSIPDNKEIRAGVFTDEEVDDLKFYAYYKKDKNITKTYKDYRENLMEQLYSGMLNQRIIEVLESGEAPFLSAGAGIGDYLADKSSYWVSATLNEDKIKEGIIAALTESERARRFGFTIQELERYKKRLLNSADVRRKEEGKINSRTYVEAYIAHFIKSNAVPGSEFTYNFYSEQLPGVTLEEVNAIGENWVRDDNISLVLAGPEKEDLPLPDKNELIAIFESVKKLDLEPYVDDLDATELMSEMPKPGKIVSSKYIKSVDVTELELSNGIKIILKPTEFQGDIINLTAYRPGGNSLVPDSLYISSRYASELINQSGVNNISSSGLRKLNMGKTVAVKPTINFYDDRLSGTSSSDDLETMFQMAHLYFTSPNKDENIFKGFKERRVESAKNEDANPLVYFNNEIAKEMSNNHLRAVPITSEQIEKDLKLDEAFDFYKERLSNADGFTFIFVGSFDIETIKPHLETYLGSLPTIKKEHSAEDIGLRYTQGNNKTYYRGKENKADVHLRFSGASDFSLEEKRLISSLGSLLRLKLYEELREKRGGVYGVRVSGFANDIPYEWYRLSIEFTSSPDNVHELVEAVHTEIDKIKTEGVSKEDFKKITEAIRLSSKQGLEYNSYWVSRLKEAYEYNLNLEEILDFNKYADELSREKLQQAAIKYLNKDFYSQFILLPEKE